VNSTNSEKWLFFDWGETLVDTFTANFHAFQNFFSTDVSDFRMVKKEQVKNFLKEAPKNGRDQALKDNWLATLRYYSDRQLWKEIITAASFQYALKIEGVDQMLFSTKEMGYKIGIVSINYIFAHIPSLKEKYLDKIGFLSDMFDTILARKDNKIKLIHKFITERPEANIVAIAGDTNADINLARYFNIKSIFVTWGSTNEDELSVTPDFIAKDMKELTSIIQELEK
jgi:phosphoglycolate phosphatase-like HAD superfamily hydrolase